MNATTRLLVLVLVTLVAGCAQSAPSERARDGTGPSGLQAQPEQTVIVAIRDEPKSLTIVSPATGAAAVGFPTRPFNAYLDLTDDRARGRPYLAEALPQLGTESWRVLPDGRMETSYRLKPNLTWHDGNVLSAEDFAFAWRAYSTEPLGFAAVTAPPLNQMEDVIATDERSLVIRWRRAYPDAGVLILGGNTMGLPALPRHILEEPFRDGRVEVFANHPYWSREFIGLGPYRLDRWEPGAFLEGAAFEGHVLGRPKIDRLRFVFISDEGTAIANLTSGAVHMAEGSTLNFDQGLMLLREWVPTGAGGMIKTTGSLRSLTFQFRADVASPPILLDARFRRALANAVDKQALNDVLWGGEAPLADSIFSSTAEFYPAIRNAIARYPYDPVASERLAREMGLARDAEGFFISPAEGQLTFDLQSTSSARTDRAIVVASFRQVGFAARESELPAAQAQDREIRAQFPGLLYQARNSAENAATAGYTSTQVARAENRWAGNNIGGWSNAGYDRLVVAFNETLDPALRTGVRGRIAQILSEELPAIPLYFQLNPNMYVTALRGLTQTEAGSMGDSAWNIHEWELR